MFGIVVLAVVAAFLAVILIRTAMFRPRPAEQKTYKRIEFDGDAAVTALQKLVQCKTVSNVNHELEDEAEFQKLIGLLPTLYPNVYEKCEVITLPDRALLFRWKGACEGEVSVLMAHYDVVPADAENWLKPPFSGEIEDDVMWGRGTIDTKVTFNGTLFAANELIGRGFTPQHDIYMAFSGGEEVNGLGAVNIVNYFRENGVKIAMAVDEGGAVVQDVFPGVKKPCALIGIAEKGMINLRYDVTSDGGHASAPAAHTPIGKLALACSKIEAHPFKAHFTKPVREMFDTLGRYSSFLYRMIFANLWCFGWIIDLMGKKSGGEINALLRTTVAFTQMQGSNALNVIPPSAHMVSNIRLNPEDTVDSAMEYIKRTVNDDEVKLTRLSGVNPSRISSTECEGWQRVVDACSGTWPEAIVSPYLMVQCSDSRHYGVISNKVYRFSAMALTAEERHTIHGNNERVPIETVKKSVEFYMRLISLC